MTTLFIIHTHFNLDMMDHSENRSSGCAGSGPESLHPDWYMIYSCDGTFYCGGWADRLKGIVATYLIANATGRKFGIHMTVPCDLSKYLTPNQVDWQVDTSKMVEDSQVFMAMSDEKLLQHSKAMNLDEMFTHHLTVFSYNLDIVPYIRQNNKYSDRFKWMNGLENHEIYKLVFDTLFNFSPEITRKLTDFNLNRLGGTSLKCAQIRLGKNPTISGDTEVRSEYSDVGQVWNFFRSYIKDLGNFKEGTTDKFQIFVTSDSEQVRSDAAMLFPKHIIDTPGHIVHIERSSGEKEEICDGFSKVILDQTILSDCETLVISKSGFGEISAYMRGKNTDLYCFRYSKLYSCSLSNFDVDVYLIAKIIIAVVVSTIVKLVLCYFFCSVALKEFLWKMLSKIGLSKTVYRNVHTQY